MKIHYYCICYLILIVNEYNNYLIKLIEISQTDSNIVKIKSTPMFETL